MSMERLKYFRTFKYSMIALLNWGSHDIRFYFYPSHNMHVSFSCTLCFVKTIFSEDKTLLQDI